MPESNSPEPKDSGHPKIPGVAELLVAMDGYGWSGELLKRTLEIVLAIYAFIHLLLEGIGIWIVTQNRYEFRRFLHRRDYAFALLKQLLADFERLSNYPTPSQGTDNEHAMPACPVSDKYRSFVTMEAKRIKNACEKEEKDEFKNGNDLGRPTWSDFYNFKRNLLPMYPKEELYAITLAVRGDFLSLATKKDREAYEACYPKTIDQTVPYGMLLAHSEHLHRQLSGIETYRPIQELKRNFITYTLFMSMLITVGVIFLSSFSIAGLIHLGWLKWNFRPSSMALAFVCQLMVLGALGATVSYQRRLQQSFDEDGWILNSTRFVGSGVGVKVTPFQGVVFAFVLVMLFHSGLLTSLLNVVDTPNMSLPGETSASSDPPPITQVATSLPKPLNENPLINISTNIPPTAIPPASKTASDQCSRESIFHFLIYGPCDLKSYAKFLVLAFLAGFAERLVPDTLDRLSLSNQKETSFKR